MHVHMCVLVIVWTPEGRIQGLVLSFYHVGSGYLTQVISLLLQVFLYLLSYLPDLNCLFLLTRLVYYVFQCDNENFHLIFGLVFSGGERFIAICTYRKKTKGTCL